jgi:DNA-binding PadR family transcriptional regulator
VKAAARLVEHDVAHRGLEQVGREITRLLDGLERAGWVEKRACERDARVSYAVLTEAGVRKFEEAQGSHRADIDELFASRFTRAERDQLAELLGRLPLAETSEACSGDH